MWLLTSVFCSDSDSKYSNSCSSERSTGVLCKGDGKTGVGYSCSCSFWLIELELFEFLFNSAGVFGGTKLFT